jgi:hypothetical protein
MTDEGPPGGWQMVEHQLKRIASEVQKRETWVELGFLLHNSPLKRIQGVA